MVPSPLTGKRRANVPVDSPSKAADTPGGRRRATNPGAETVPADARVSAARILAAHSTWDTAQIAQHPEFAALAYDTAYNELRQNLKAVRWWNRQERRDIEEQITEIDRAFSLLCGDDARSNQP